jgi:hypothetical protein
MDDVHVSFLLGKFTVFMKYVVLVFDVLFSFHKLILTRVVSSHAVSVSITRETYNIFLCCTVQI